MDNYATHTPMDNDEDPEALAANYTCRPFPDTDSVLKGIGYDDWYCVG